MLVNGAPARFTFVQPTYPGDPKGQNDPDPLAHEAGELNPVGGPENNPFPPACTPELMSTNPNKQFDLDGTQGPANKLVITPARPIASGATFVVVVVNYTGRPGVHNDGDGTTEGWFRVDQPGDTGSFVTTEPVASEDRMPLNDHPSSKPTYDFYDTVPLGKTAIANGELVSQLANLPDANSPGGSTTWQALAEHGGPNNLSRDDSVIAAQILFLNVTDPHGPANAGSLRPLRVLTRPGSVFDACPPAAFATYYEVRMRLYDLMWRCLAPRVGERLPAGHFASICGTFIGGRHPDTGRHFTIVEPQVGGWGGSAGRDGKNAMFSGIHGHTFNCPAEVAEARYGLYVDRLALSDEPGGEGEQRGGKGVVVEYRVRSDGCFLTCAYTRNKHPPWAVAGGRDGSPNYVEVVRRDGTIEEHAVVTALEVSEGDVMRLHTGNGAGYGDPRRRPRERVLDDLRNGYVSDVVAREVYGLATQ